ncbi:DUF3099 domain-containing protein [Arthrobacter sp. M4]|uniref:DUF3099 domain-containing protein n=1 Tax=Arthrobacter sp. M4 TaxID=218160 RepID=UPI001CDC0CDB|nr:DUF3099 domain-containing protein [Arthrobacter sp. M4]MCA4131503.1 DUF3099 domain-containing protein [Arthrobacter sp. M4]
MERDLSAVTQQTPPQPGQDPEHFSGDTVVHSITDAAAPHSEDMRERMIKYALAMGIRMVCIILIFVVDGWLKILAIAGAVFLPWIAVVIANGSDKAEVHSDALLDYVSAAELEASQEAGQPDERTADEEDSDGELIQGELIEDKQEGNEQDGDERAAS